MRTLWILAGALTIGWGVGCGSSEKGSAPATISKAKPLSEAEGPAAEPAARPQPKAKPAPTSMTYEDLLLGMIDLTRLPLPPKPGVTCKQFSSYDRASRIDASGKKIDWQANADFGNYLRTEGDEWVMADMKGPGCVVRLWSANPMGVLKIYLDGRSEPVLAERFLDLTTGKVKPFAEPIVGRRSMGANLYLPIPYQKSCKITIDHGKNAKKMYYLIDYWTYTPDTKLPTWSRDLLRQNRDTYTKVCTVLSDPSGGPEDLPALTGKKTSLPPGKKTAFTMKDGPAAIRALKVKASAPTLDKALREVALSITSDGADPPQVWAPLGDFFGTAPGIHPYKGLPLGMLEDGWMYCYWMMPYNKTAVVTFHNQGKQEVELDVRLATKKTPGKDLLTFNTGWRRSNPNTTFDWPFLRCEGRGRYVGVAMFVFNPVRHWWGEGDEKVWVDGERFPSWYGTGSEDYFGYAWCCNQPFRHAYHNQPRCDGPGNMNHSSVNRFHIIDSIPFQKSFLMTIENYGKDKDYACTTYWYATAESKDFFEPVPVERRGISEKKKPPKPKTVKGAIEGEKLRIVARETEGQCSPQDMEGFGPHWSGNGQMWFRPTKDGQWVEFELPVDTSGEYKVIVHGTKAIDYGKVRYAIDGQTLGKPIDGFHDGVVHFGPVELGTVKLERPKAKLRMEVVGKNPKATGYMAGLDCVVLAPAK